VNARLLLFGVSAALLLTRTALSQSASPLTSSDNHPFANLRIGEVEFFGTAGIDLASARAALPVHEGEGIAAGGNASIRSRIEQALTQATGHQVSDVAFICCDTRGGLMIYVGLGGSNTATVSSRPAPHGNSCLPNAAVLLFVQTTNYLAEAVSRGITGVDDSPGYALSADPATRAKQMEMRRYAISHEPTIERALRSCPSNRAAAAALLGYAHHSQRQITALMRATRDADIAVRNYAIRSLRTLAVSSPKIAASIPAGEFVDLLNSGLWLDRNKVGSLLAALTAYTRNTKVLRRMREEALPSLIEMARWQNAAQADVYRVLLGRIAGLDEARIEELKQSGRVDEIISAARFSTQ
jgi:hypothetical protein